MRTYGAHGGENQLSRYFSSDPAGNVHEHFAFVFRDRDCAELFQRRRGRVVLHNLIGLSISPRQNPWLELLQLMPFLPFAQLRLLWLARSLNARVCVVHGVQAALIAWPTALLMRRHAGFLYVHRITKATGRNPALRWLYAPYRFLAGVSEAVTRSLEGLAPGERLVTLANGVDWPAITGAPAQIDNGHASGKRLISVGRLLAHKRQDILIRAFAKLSRSRPELVLWIVGDGAHRASLEAEAARLGVGDRVVFWGHRSDVPKLLAAATVFVNASAWEGMSNAVLEAMALGLPSVVCDAPGVTECHIPGQTGIVAPPDADAMATAIATLLDDAGSAKRMGEAARERVRVHYSTQANRQRFLDVYARLAEGVS